MRGDRDERDERGEVYVGMGIRGERMRGDRDVGEG
jgi:hypothetical protein